MLDVEDERVVGAPCAKRFVQGLFSCVCRCFSVLHVAPGDTFARFRPIRNAMSSGGSGRPSAFISQIFVV